MRDTNEWALAIVAPWEHGSDEHRQWLRDIAVPAVEWALREARIETLHDVRRGLIPISEESISPGLVEVAFQLGWSSCLSSLNGLTLRLVREMGEKP